MNITPGDINAQFEACHILKGYMKHLHSVNWCSNKGWITRAFLLKDYYLTHCKSTARKGTIPSASSSSWTRCQITLPYFRMCNLRALSHKATMVVTTNNFGGVTRVAFHYFPVTNRGHHYCHGRSNNCCGVAHEIMQEI